MPCVQQNVGVIGDDGARCGIAGISFEVSDNRNRVVYFLSRAVIEQQRNVEVDRASYAQREAWLLANLSGGCFGGFRESWREKKD